ncbi:MAG: circularly permuted type 2 ATP-grasp protein [Myxococcota bacterium]
MGRTRADGAVKEKGHAPKPLFEGYTPLESAYDELFTPAGNVRRGHGPVVRRLDAVGQKDFRLRQRIANNAFLRSGITFRVYSDQRGVEKIFPFDLIPRLVDPARWEKLERGLKQRVACLDALLGDLYGPQKILKDGVIPKEIVLGSKGYLPELQGVRPPGGVYVHVSGIDLIRAPNGDFLVLEDNARTPSGVSYVLENRAVMKRVFPRLFQRVDVRSVGEYPARLRAALEGLAAEHVEGRGDLVVLTPGHFNSAYFEHSFLARRMGVPLAQGSDLFVHDDRVYVKTTKGPERVTAIYRRIDDEFLDPQAFREDSLLGVPGLVRAYAKGNVVLANALGNGCVDDKAVYPFIPKAIRYYLGEDPILDQVQTYLCSEDADRSHVLANLGSMVVKAVDASGGYGMLFGPKSTKKLQKEFAARIQDNPRGYIAQPVVELSTCPTWTKGGVAPRRVDFRPYIVTGEESWVLPGGLTRVALREGSYVVNSSQGGGSKDTWVLGSNQEAGE